MFDVALKCSREGNESWSSWIVPLTSVLSEAFRSEHDLDSRNLHIILHF